MPQKSQVLSFPELNNGAGALENPGTFLKKFLDGDTGQDQSRGGNKKASAARRAAGRT